MTRADDIWRCPEMHFRSAGHLRQGVIKQRQLLTKQCKGWHERSRLVCMFHEIHLVVDGCTTGINPHSAYNDKRGKEYSQYVTEFLHKRCKDRKF